MKYVVALGNPGPEYAKTRHNVGWLCADILIAKLGFSELVFNAKYQARISSGEIAGESVMILYPDTYMNHSGVVTKKLGLQNPSAELIVLQDEVDLPLGEIKLSSGRGHGGHNGIRSIVEHLGTKDFARMRIGISPTSFFTGKIKRPQGEKLPKFVLGKFTSKEEKVVGEIGLQVSSALEVWVKHGLPMAMNKFN
ncbi:MAG: aminoacyl-tRNA hydrolase [Candidatus Paceibacterota bacterium]